MKGRGRVILVMLPLSLLASGFALAADDSKVMEAVK
jgi:hypothetical protein